MKPPLDHAPTYANPGGPCVGVFDSGVGGLSVLRALRRELPHARLLYVADTGHAPYGERSDAHVLERSHRIAAHLLAQGAAGVVVACNTATAVAIRQLRDAWPHVPIVGVEPGLKPAVTASRNGRIGVLATTGTLSSEKFRRLLRAEANGITVVAHACPGLARLIEQGNLEAPELLEAIRNHCAALRSLDVDTVVLGCTHYTFVRTAIQTAMGDEVRVIDTPDAVARHCAQRFAAASPDRARNLGEPPSARLQTTGDDALLRRIARAWLPFECTVERAHAL